jgi:hypothetical protein
MSLRLKGLECTLRFTGPDGGEDSLVKIKDFEINAKGEILKEDYTGAVALRETARAAEALRETARATEAR